MNSAKRPYHHGDLRAAFLRAGEQALKDGGIDQLTLRGLSRQLGVSHTAPLRHFAGKQALLDALAIDGFKRFHATLTHAVAGREPAFDRRMLKLGQAFVRFGSRHAELYALMLATKHRHGAPPELLEAAQRAYAVAAATVQEGQTQGAVVDGDPIRLALFATAVCEGLLAISTGGRFKGLRLEDLVVDAIQQIIVGLRPRG